MKKGEIGQALILVLILLAVGSLLLVPALRLTGTAFKSNEIVTRHVRALYAAGGAQEYVIWKLLYTDFASQFTTDGQQANIAVDVCGSPVNITVVMRAKLGGGGITLATDDVMRPTKTVSPNVVPDGSTRTYTYIIRLEQLSDNNTQGLDVVYDILPKTFGTNKYVAGSSYIRVDGGAWEPLAAPLAESSGYGGQERLRWPASGNFPSPIRDFAVRQVKEIKFQVTSSLLNNRTYYNWVVIKPWDTLSGATANLTVGSGANPEGGLLAVDKTSNPQIIQPGVETDIEYTVIITNLADHAQQIQEVTDYLPPGFNYIGGLASGITTIDPQLSLENLNGIDRWQLHWTTAEFPNGNAVQIASGTTLTLTFWGRTTKDISGSYYNEVIAVPNEPLPQIFSDIGITQEELNTNYSWNAGAVLVPFFDSRSDAGAVVIDANLGLILGGLTIESWQVK